MRKILLCGLLVALPLFAQEKKDTPKLDKTSIIAIQAVSRDYNQALGDIIADIQLRYPGYTFDVQSFFASGKYQLIEKPKTPAATVLPVPPAKTPDKK